MQLFSHASLIVGRSKVVTFNPDATPFSTSTIVMADEARTLTVEGEVDLYTAPQLRAAIAAIPLDGTLVIDLGAVSFIDSVGFGVLLGAWKRSLQAGGDLRFRAVPASIVRKLSVMGLDQVLTFDQ
jgi:anti-sigma B factor antagonist